MTPFVERNRMRRIMITCPNTGKSVPIGIRAFDKSDYEAMDFVGEPVECPACGQIHAWTKKDTYLEKLLDLTTSFHLLLEEETFLQIKSSIDSILDFVKYAYGDSDEMSEILCVTGDNQPSYLQDINDYKKKYGIIQIIPPVEWNLPYEREPYYGPDIVKYFHIAAIRSRGEFIIIIEPGKSIISNDILVFSIQLVKRNPRLLMVSHNMKKTALPTSSILANSSLGGSTTTVASNYNIRSKKMLFGGIRYCRTHKDFKPSVPWLIGGIAFEFQNDQFYKRDISFAEWI